LALLSLGGNMRQPLPAIAMFFRYPVIIVWFTSGLRFNKRNENIFRLFSHLDGSNYHEMIFVV
jgi:hypothetical protein